MMAPTKMKLRVRKKEKGSAKSSQQPLRPEASPDSKCPICLDRFVNVASVERCLHRFCFRCICEWAKNKAECPLCKQPFRSIFHSVRAENDFKEFVVLEDNTQNATTSASATVTMTAAAIAAAPAGQTDAEGTATHTLRHRATRTSLRRSQRAQDPAPSASSMEGVALDHATLMQRNPACLRRLLPLLRRERVMGPNPSELHPLLLARTDHILHELVSFARSIEAMHCPPTPSYEEDSGSQSSIINISEDDDDSVEADVTENTTQDPILPVPMPTSSEISLSQSAWDDETPGPSYSTLSHSQMEKMEPEGNQLGGTSAASDECEHNDEEDECMIVGYVKPMAERTPELVQLSSDSTEEDEGNEAAAADTEVKAESSVPSQEQAPVSPKPYPSTSHTERGENLDEPQEQAAGNPSHPRRQEHTPSCGFGNPSHLLSGSQTSSECSPQSGRSVQICGSRRLSSREPRVQGHQSLGQNPTVFTERDGSSSEELVPLRSVSARDKSFKSLSPWDSPGHNGERKRKRRKRRRERETDRSRSPHWESRHRHGDQELWLRSSSSDAESRREKPAGKRKYKTRHLERTARRRSRRKSRQRERERSPSVEIIFERRVSDTHSRGGRHKKRSRRKQREPNSPTIITIDSDSSSLNAADFQNHHTEANSPTADSQNRRMDASSNTADSQNRHTDASGHATDSQNRFMGNDKRDVANDHSLDYRDHNADDSERVTDFSDHTIDYQEHLVEFSDRTSDVKSCVTDARNHTTDYTDDVGDENRAAVFNDRTAECNDDVAGVSSQTSDYNDKLTEAGDSSTDYKRGIQKHSDQADEHHGHAATVSGRAANHTHNGVERNSKSKRLEVSDYMADVKPCDEGVNDGTAEYQHLFWDQEDGFQDSVMDLGERGELNASVLDLQNLEHCLVDVVQPNRRLDDGSYGAATLLADTRLLELEESLLGEGQGTPGSITVDQSEAEVETAHADVTRDSGVSAEMSPDV